MVPSFVRSYVLSRSATRQETRIYHVYKKQSLIVSLVVKGKFGKISKSLKILWNWLSTKFSFAFMLLLTTDFVKNSLVYCRISFIFLKDVLNQTRNAFNTKFRYQSKHQKSSYQVKAAFALFCKLIALTLS